MDAQWSLAVAEADVARLAELLAAGSDINARNRRGQTALMVAAQSGQTSVVGLLVTRGAELNHAAKYGLTALMLAVLNGHVEIVRLLAAAGADLARRGTGAPGFYGKTAADLASGQGDREMTEILLRSRTSST